MRRLPPQCTYTEMDIQLRTKQNKGKHQHITIMYIQLYGVIFCTNSVPVYKVGSRIIEVNGVTRTQLYRMKRMEVTVDGGWAWILFALSADLQGGCSGIR